MDYSKLNTVQLIKKETELYIKGITTCIDITKANKLDTEEGDKKIKTAFDNFKSCKTEMRKRGIPVPDRSITPDIILMIGNE